MIQETLSERGGERENKIEEMNKEIKDGNTF